MANEAVPLRKTVGKVCDAVYSECMSDNVIKFQRKPQPKPPRQTPPWAKRVLVIAAVIAFFLAAFLYFSLTGSS